MIDVNKITSTLAKLPDAQLQQYAQMHKNDPYIMALAMSESNRRKELRDAGQAAQGMQEQPKVVDRMVAEMAPQPAPQQLPEEMGIARIPAGDMNFAGGGIVAFADGGDVERYSGQFGSLTGDIPGFVAGTGNFIPQAGAPEEVPLLRRLFRDARATGANYQAEQARARIAAGVGTAADQAILAAAQSTQSTAPTATAKPGPTPQEMAQFDAATNLYMTERAAKQAAANANRKDKGPKAPAAAAAPILTSDTAGLDKLDPRSMFASTLKTLGAEERPEAEMLEKLNAERKTAAESELAGVKALNERFADAFKSRRERLDTREGAISKMKDQNFGLALLQAGAAMMSTPGNLGTAIGRGVQTGSQQYVAGIDKINAAKDKLADARDRLDDLQLNRDEMSAREILKAENKIRDTALSGKENMIKFVMERDKVNRETAAKIVDAQLQIGLTQYKETQQNKRSAAEIQGRITAAQLSNQPPAQMQIAMALGNGDLEAGFKKIKDIEAGKFSVANSYADYLKAFAGKETMNPPLSFANYAAQFGATLPR